jgi:hypothetical protein
VETARWVSQDELRRWRSKLPRGWQRAVSTPKTRIKERGQRVGEDAAQFDTPVFKPQGPKETHEQVVQHLLSNARRSREDFQLAVRGLRVTNPSLIAHLTDEQAVDMLEKGWGERVRQAVTEVYNRTGRSNELKIKIGGF